MIIEQPPLLYRLLFPGSIWRIPSEEGTKKSVYLTFDDGPVPEITPWVLDILDQYQIKATFFCVGDNVHKYPTIYQSILDKGHRVGNHTFNHLQGIRTLTKTYLKNSELAAQYIESNLFRPPHGHLRLPQFLMLRRKYKIVLWDVVTRDYSRYMTPPKILQILKRYTRNGSIIVFHDSKKSYKNLAEVLPLAIEWLREENYQFKVID